MQGGVMRAVVLREFGGPEVLKMEEIAVPSPGPGEVLIRVANVSVNVTLDIAVRKGVYARKPSLPHVLGVDPAGEVVRVGEGVTQFGPGDRVFVHASGVGIGTTRWGGYAEYVVAPAHATCRLPDRLGYREATVLLRHLPTARHLMHAKAAVQPGEWVLVMGAAGGLAACCIQVAKRMGARVIGAAGSDDRVQKGLAYGADYGVNYRTQDLAAEALRLTGGEGVHVVAENIGDPDLWPGAFNSLRMHGRLVTAGAHGGGEVKLDLRRLYLKRITIMGDPSADSSDLQWSLEAAREGFIAPEIDRVMPLAGAAEAHTLIETRAASGKVLLDPAL
jgi:2-desacetyl-2-hydroxyethyl bacteriochlorophyllide A dehydrogenase